MTYNLYLLKKLLHVDMSLFLHELQEILGMKIIPFPLLTFLYMASLSKFFGFVEKKSEKETTQKGKLFFCKSVDETVESGKAYMVLYFDFP